MELSPLMTVPRNHLLMVLKCYFDGGNEADSQQYSVVTLAAFSGTVSPWEKFEIAWNKNLKAHGAPYLHTTDAVGLTGVFSKRNGWTETKVEKFIADCVGIIERCAAVKAGRKIVKNGIRPVTITVILSDFKKALEENPKLMTVEHLCATQCVPTCVLYGRLIMGADQFQLFFDQGEPFYGHIHDRMTNKKSRADTLWKHVVHAGESNMRNVPALQAADVLAWSVNHYFEENRARYNWQSRILGVDRDGEVFNLDYLRQANRE